MKRMLVILVGLAAGFAPAVLHAQTISQPTDNGTVLTNGPGQSFVATINGNVTVIGIRPTATARRP